LQVQVTAVLNHSSQSLQLLGFCPKSFGCTQIPRSFQLSLKNITGVIGAHIHNDKQGENGPVVANLFNPTNPIGAINGKLMAGTLTSSKLTGSLHNKELSALVNMISGEAYVNVHTTQNQNGEIRGQIS